MKTVETSIKSIFPYHRNNKIHSETQVNRIAESIKQYGFNQPIVCDKNNIIVVGHARLEAAKQLGLETVPVLHIDVTDEQARQYRILDNKLSDQAEYDFEALNFELEELELEGFDLNFWGLGEISTGEDEVDDSESEATESDDGSIFISAGDKVELGSHTIVCGDCDDVDLPKCDLLLTDPPYGVNMDKGFEGFGGFGGFGTPIKRREYKDNWDSEIPEKQSFDNLLSKSKLAIIFGGNFFAHLLPQGTHWIFWDKLQSMPTFGDGELAWTNSDRKSISKIEIQYNGLIGKETDRVHPTQKPLKLWLEILKQYGKNSKTVLDPFSGSGTTLIACERLGLVAYCVEKEPKYVQATIKRYLTECEKTEKEFICTVNGEAITAEMLNGS